MISHYQDSDPKNKSDLSYISNNYSQKKRSSNFTINPDIFDK